MYLLILRWFVLIRNLSLLENLVTVLIAVIVGALGALVLTRNFYHDILVFVFCFIMAGCQYSLLKVRSYRGINLRPIKFISQKILTKRSELLKVLALELLHLHTTQWYSLRKLFLKFYLIIFFFIIIIFRVSSQMQLHPCT